MVLGGGGRHALSAGFDDWRFVHEALPDLDHARIDLGVDFLGRRLKAPFLVSAMTGGPARAEAINARLAEAAQQEANNLEQSGQMSASGTKKLRYQTRKLTQKLTDDSSES